MPMTKPHLLLLVALLGPAWANADVICSTAQQTCTTGSSGGGGGASTSGDNTWTGAQSFIDNKFLISDDGDATKKAAFQLSGITAGQTRTLTVPNASGTLATLEGNQTFTGLHTFTGSGATFSGATFGNGGNGISTDYDLRFGSSGDYATIKFSPAQVPNSVVLSPPPAASSNSFIIAEREDRNYNFAHATATNPTFFFHSANQSTVQFLGISHNGTDALLGTGSGAIKFSPANSTILSLFTAITAGSGVRIGWSANGDPTGTGPTAFFVREGDAIIELGADVNGAAVAQTLKAHDGITGTNIAGANLTLAGGRGTGSGAGGNVILQTAPALASGTTAQTLADRDLIIAKPKALTEGAATSFVRVAVASGSTTAFVLHYEVRASDATDVQSRSGVLPVSVVNKAGTETCVMGTVGAATEVVAVSAGTLTNTFTCDTTPTNAVDIQADATSSLTQTTLEISSRVLRVSGAGSVTAQ